MTTFSASTTIQFGGVTFPISRPHSFGLVIDHPTGGEYDEANSDYLHTILLTPDIRESFFDLVEAERLVVCRNVRSEASTYRRVRGKSSVAKLSQAEYYHHDGCSSPEKPRIVEIRCPHQTVGRNIATAIAPFPAVIRAMLACLPESRLRDDDLLNLREAMEQVDGEESSTDHWDSIQGRVTRWVRREFDAEGCRDYFRQVDARACAYVLPWQMGESRLMLNSHPDLSRTMQHRRAYQQPRHSSEQSGSLVKRWPAEELVERSS